jgi:hypothetical protein
MMYYPYLYGKREELFALASLLGKWADEKKTVCPILSPIDTKSTIKRVILEHAKAECPLILVGNPYYPVGSPGSSEIAKELLTGLPATQALSIGFAIRESTTPSDFQAFARAFRGMGIACIHFRANSNSGALERSLASEPRITKHIFRTDRMGAEYIKLMAPRGSSVALEQRFVEQARNADYPGDEYFSEAPFQRDKRFDGFGDYAVLSEYVKRGGPAYAVALHWTYLRNQPTNQIWVCHFISDDVETQANVQGKYFQALAKLVRFASSDKMTPDTEGKQDYQENNRDEIYHGLGFPKRCSIKHHIELMSKIIRS